MRLGGGIRYVGRQIAGDLTSLQVVMPGYTLADVLLGFERRQWALQLNAVNLTNHFYYATSSQFGYCINGSKRTVNAG